MAVAPTAAAAPADDAAPVDDMAPAPEAEAGDTVVVTICKSADGVYTVYAGEEPEEPGEPAEGEEPAAAPEGEKADSIGAALKAAMDILKQDEDQAGGDQFSAGYKDGAGMGDEAPPKPTADAF